MSASSLRPVRSTCDQPRIALSGVRSSCESVARNSSFISLRRSAAARAARSLSSRAVALGGSALRRLVEACVVDGDAGLRGNAGDEALGPLGEHAGLRVAEEQSTDDLARPGLTGTAR